MKNSISFTKSLKFKLTIWYSVILSVFCIAFVLSINVWLTNYMNDLSTESMSGGFWMHNIDRPRLRALSLEQKEIVMESRLQDLDNIRRVSVYMVIPLVVLSFGGGYLIATVMLNPLEKLNKEIREKEASTLKKELEFVDNGDEISELFRSFNRMSRRLGKSFESQREFVENASHELKTPLSIIQANLDTVLDDDMVGEKELKKLLSNSRNQVKMMDKLTEDLLLLSLVSSDVEIEMEDIDLGSLLVDMVGGLESMTKDSGMDINLKKVKGVKVKGNRVLLGRAISNIVENSLKYSKGSRVDIVLKKEKDVIKITLEDDGKGIPKDKGEVIFERFYRLDKGRSRKEGGTGLGLSISRDIIQKHRGSISLDREYKKGARFVIEFNKL